MENDNPMPSLTQKASQKRAPNQEWLRLDANDSMAGIVVTPADGDSFALTKEVAFRAFKIVPDLERLDEQIRSLLHDLTDWIEDHGGNIQSAYLTFGGEYFQFLVVQRDKSSDSILEDALTELDIRIAQSKNFDLIRLSVLAIPNASEATIRSFLPPRGNLVYSNARRDVSPEAG